MGGVRPVLVRALAVSDVHCSEVYCSVLVIRIVYMVPVLCATRLCVCIPAALQVTCDAC